MWVGMCVCQGLLPGQRQLGWPGKEDVELPPEMTAVQLYSANLFDFGEGGTHILASIAAKSLAKAATQLQVRLHYRQLGNHRDLPLGRSSLVNTSRRCFVCASTTITMRTLLWRAWREAKIYDQPFGTSSLRVWVQNYATRAYQRRML